jgi:two-component system NtrC family sensor kinase
LDLVPWTDAAADVLERKRILIVDDNADMRSYLTSLLSPRYDVETAANGAEGLLSVRQKRPDLVLSDVMMPVMDGVSLLSELKSDSATNTIPVILLSARAGEEARLEGIETGADDYLVKPFATRELLARVNTHLKVAAVHKAAAETARELAATRARFIHDLEQANQSLLASYKQLTETQAQLVHSAKMASLGELVAGIAHEINNPLAFVKSHLLTVTRLFGDLEPSSGSGGSESGFAKARVRLTEIERGVDRIQQLVVKLRVFSRLDEGERKLASIKECVESIVTILRHRLGQTVDLVQVLDGPDVVDCYPSLLNQALMNLIANAIDAVEGNGTIVVMTSAENGIFRISVADSGPGIPEELRARVLEPFFTTKPVGQGTGLGLSIAYSIAKKHGGELTVARAPVGGALFTLSFPLERPARP